MITEHSLLRKKLERAIIGICLTQTGAFGEVINVLSPQNFRKWEDGSNHPFIWEMMLEVYPQRHIDLLTVAHYINVNRGVNCHYLLSKCGSEARNASHLFTYAFQLLEFDIQNRFLKLLLEIGSLIPAENITHKAAITEAYDIVNSKAIDDLLFTINGLILYLDSIGIEGEPIDRCNDFMQSINIKAFEIKRTKTIDIILTNLLNYGSFEPNYETKSALENLTEMIGILYFKKNATAELNETLTLLKQKLTVA
jgi:hypothetical protein